MLTRSTISAQILFVCIFLTFFSGSCTSETKFLVISAFRNFNNHPTYYEVADAIDDNGNPILDSSKTPLLLLNGFAMGTFYQRRLIHEMLQREEHRGRRIFCVEYLGQGRSWPRNCKNGNGASERGLRYCEQTWFEQIIDLIQGEIIQTDKNNISGIHIVGNSIGGHLAVCVAASRPDLVESICLLNATPFWGLNLPGWSGYLPVPKFCEKVARLIYDQLSDLTNLKWLLGRAYANANEPVMESHLDSLARNMRACTMHPGGRAAFASMLWSPPVAVPIHAHQPSEEDHKPLGDDRDEEPTSYASFDECLEILQCNVLLLYGRQDPLCGPGFAKILLRKLEGRMHGFLPSSVHYAQRYVELSPVGHCPNDEAPRAVATLLTRWMENPLASLIVPNKSKTTGGNSPEKESVMEDWGEVFMQELDERDISPSNGVDEVKMRFAQLKWLLDRLISAARFSSH